jgi:hypothetical protein
MCKKINYLELAKEFNNTGYPWAKDFSQDKFLVIAEFILRKSNKVSTKGNFGGTHICTDNECYCGKYKKGELMIDCDGGCQYPGV